MREVVRQVRAMRPHRHIKKGLTHPNRLVAAATWLVLLGVMLVLIRLVVVLAGDFWLFMITWMQP